MKTLHRRHRKRTGLYVKYRLEKVRRKGLEPDLATVCRGKYLKVYYEKAEAPTLTNTELGKKLGIEPIKLGLWIEKCDMQVDKLLGEVVHSGTTVRDLVGAEGEHNVFTDKIEQEVEACSPKKSPNEGIDLNFKVDDAFKQLVAKELASQILTKLFSSCK